jgi:hypothetical protein
MLSNQGGYMKDKNNGGFIVLLCFMCIGIYICSAIGNGNSNVESSLPTTVVKISSTAKKIPTSTKQIVLNGCVTDSTIRMRENPGTEFEVIGGLTSGTCFKILGRNSNSSWAYIITDQNTRGWVAAWLITVQGNLSSLPITSNLVSFTPTPFIDKQPSTSNQDLNNKNNCLAAYTSVCIPPGRDLDCKDIPYNNFPVTGGDPFNFDLDGDGIGCE